MAMTIFAAFAGSFNATSSLVTYIFDPKAPAPGNLVIQNSIETILDTSNLALHPTEQALYMGGKVYNSTDSVVAPFRIEGGPGQYTLTPFKAVSVGGARPSYVGVLDDGKVAITNSVNDSSYRMIPTAGSTWELGELGPVANLPGTSQAVQIFQSGPKVFVTDSGADKVWLLTCSNGGTWDIAGSIDLPSGCGPRRAIVRDNMIFTLCQLSNILTVQATGPSPNPVLANVSITPEGAPAATAFRAGELLFPPPSDKFSERLLYASNRNTYYGYTSQDGVSGYDPRGDSIAIIKYTPGANPTLVVVNQVFTNLGQVEGVAFNNDGQYLIVGGWYGGVKVYRRDGDGSILTEVGRKEEMAQTSFVWMSK